tara:strand:- start:853 stop:1152 length:300 start_codon:yes stop_codon:yes gene_type:complete
MNNKMTQITFDELYAHQERLCQQSLAQLIRLNQWKEDGIIYDEPDQEMLVGESSEILNSLQRKKDQRKKEILALDQQIRLEKEKDRRRREMDASRKKNK